MLATSVTPIVGLPKFDGWSQVIIDPSHTWVVVFSVGGPNAGNVGRDVVDLFKGKTFHQPNDFHHILQQVIEDANQKEAQLQLASIWLGQENKAVLATYQGILLLKRNEKVGQVLSSNDLKIVEGRVGVDDIFVLLTQSSQTFEGEIKQKLIQGYDVDTTVTSLVPGVHAAKNSAICGMAFCEISNKLAQLHDSKPAKVDEDQPVAMAAAVSVAMSQPVSQQSAAKTTANILNAFGAGWQLSKKLIKGSGHLFWRIVRRNEYVHKSGSAKKPILVLGLILAIVVLGAVVAVNVYKIQKFNQQVETQLLPFREKLSQAVSMESTDPVAARGQVEEVITDLTSLVSKYESNKFARKTVQDLLDEAQSTHQQISGKKAVEQLPIFYDLRLAQNEFIANSLVIENGVGFFLDTEKSQLAKLDLKSKQVELIETKPIEAPKHFSINDNGVWAVGAKVGLLPSKAKDFKEMRGEEDDVKGVTKLGTFDQYVYLLNAQSRAIFRYALTQEGDKLADPRRWLKSPLGLDWSTVTDMAIDGDVWLTTSQGSIVKLTAGEESEFTVSGLTDAFASSLKIAVKPDLDKIFILEPSRNRIVVLNDKGQFLQEYKSDSLSAATDLDVTADGKIIYAISGSIVFEITL